MKQTDVLYWGGFFTMMLSMNVHGAVGWVVMGTGLMLMGVSFFIPAEDPVPDEPGEDRDEEEE